MSISISHIFREANLTADCLARYKGPMDEDFLLFNSPPDFLLSYLEADKPVNSSLSCL
uniref:Uncharacterized protein n=1 Tax=Cajanus cajan TaxID=3821 RepID=A0A151STB8_CAJCA|nr:hypothetical protein KK1_004298 [Cajanus cajan]